jgi:hypothetical protein
MAQCYISMCHVLARLGVVACRLELTPSLAGVHNVFHVSQLKKCLKSIADVIVDDVAVDVSYVALQAHGIVNVALHRGYSPGVIFIFFQGRKYIYHV